MDGFYNRILKIDLGKRQFQVDIIEDRIYESFLGGKGLAAWLLHDLNPESVDPLSGDNHLIFVTGPVTGSMVWGGSRYGVVTKSPLTGLFAASWSGGKVPEAVSATGFDAIVIKGKLDELSVLEVTPEGVLFHPVPELKGQDTFATERFVKEKYGRKRTRSWRTGVSVVGPAAENGVSFSIIKNDGWRCAGRTGTGTVMGSKNIKAVVFSGDKKRDIHHSGAMIKLSKMMSAESKESPVVHAYKSMGTSQMVKVLNSVNAFPTKYWTRGSAPHWEMISADALHSQCDVVPHACAKCFLACGRMTTIKKGRHKGLRMEGPEYETIFALGGLCMIDSIEEVAYLNHLCDAYGMDTITAGNLCAFAMRAFELGRSEYSIRFGDAEKTADLIRLIASRQGVGELLSQGIIPAARAWNLEDQAVHVKGMEPAGYDPRVLKGMGLAYATSDRGACHLRATFYKPELAGMIDPGQIEGKAELFIDFEDRLTLFDSLILCKFYRDLYPWELLEDLITAVTGMDGSIENLKKIAGNIMNKVRTFNIREGMTPDMEKLPPALFNPLQDTGAMISENDMSRMITEYHSLREWDSHTGL